jgi:VWFA-related protein
MRRLCALLVFAAAGAGLIAAERSQATFRAQADSVRVDVAVLDRGRPVTGLKAADFELFDNGVAQEIADLGQEELPIDVTIALDVSDSVSGPVLEQLRRSIQQLRGDFRPRDRLSLVTFNMRIKRILDFNDPRSAADAALGQIRAGGSTAMFDTIAIALAAPASPGRRQLVVLFSDGEDSNSITDPGVLLEVARRTTPTLDIVLAGRDGNAAASAGSARVQSLTALTRETGGVVEMVRPGDSLSSQFRRLFAEFRSSYVIHFVPRGVERAGVHTIDVRVKRPTLTVRARRAYSFR